MQYVIIALYIASLGWTAWLGWRRTHTFDDHLVAGRRMPVWLASFTIAATLIGSGVVIGVSELSYKAGVSAMLYPASLAVALALSILVAASRFRQSEAVTVPELLARHYGEDARTLVALASALKWMGPTAAQYLAVGAIIKSATGWSMDWSIALSAVVIVAYVIIGGAWAIAYTDMAQLIFVYLGLTLLFVDGYSEFGGAFTIARGLGPEYLDWTGAGVGQLTTWIGAIVALSFADQVWLQRSASARTPREAVTAGLWGAALVFPIGYLAAYAGLAAAATLPGIEPREAVPALIFSRFDPLSAALFVTAVVAAAMSSCDSWLHSSATLLVKDIYAGRINPAATGRQMERMMTLATVALGFGSVVISLLWQGGIITLVFLTLVWGSCIYIGPLLLIWYSPVKISPRAALWIVSLTLAAGTALSLHPPYGISPLLITSALGYLLTGGAYLVARGRPSVKKG